MATEESSTPKLSPVEGIKESSQYLRGTLAEELASDADHLSDTAKNLLKFHGSYLQEDRDARKTRPKGGVGKAYMFMIRLKLPGGRMNAKQYLAMDEIADRHANGTLRLTTRQSIQFHGVLKGNLKATIADINAALVSTLGACGDVNRNVMTCPAPTNDPVRTQMNALAYALAEHLAPKAGNRAYHEIWLNGEKITEPEQDEEPLYGKVYLPRKFKTALALPHDNCTDILANCLGFLAVTQNNQPIGYNVYVGGGQGRTHGKAETFAHLAQPLCFVEPNDVVYAAENVLKFYRDHGNRGDRKRARLKYVIADWGMDKVRSVYARDYHTKTLQLPKDVPITGLDLHLGWHAVGNGKVFLGLSVENGRIKDEAAFRLRTGVREIVRKYQCDVGISAQQDLLLSNLRTEDKLGVEAMLAEYGIPLPGNLSMVRKWSMACPAIPTCPLAITESERALPALVRELEHGLEELGLGGEPISVRMTGCPNGCARPYQSEIGLVGRSGEKYTVYIGGDSFGRRMNVELQDLVPKYQIVPKLKVVFTNFKNDRQGTESFGDYCARVGLPALRAMVGATADAKH
jgi:sulfite reductase (ferredoxin)